MKIILLESLPKILKQDILDWNKATQSEKSKMLDEIIKKYNKPELFNIRPAIKNNFYRHGINPKENPFVNFLDTLKFKPTKKQDVNFMRLGDLIVSDHIDITKDYLTKESLYDRNEKDFIYTVKLFDIVNDRSKISKYFKDTTNITEADLYLDDSMNEIKPAGKDGDGIDTLYGTVESWSGEDGKNDSKYDENEKDGYTLNQALEQIGVPKNGYSEIINIWLNKYYDEAIKLYEPVQSSIEHYKDMLNLILQNDIKRLSQQRLNDIKRKYAFKTLDDIPDNLKKDGNIIWVEVKKFYNDVNRYTEESNQINDYMIYSDNKWQKYDDYISNGKKSNPNVDKAYNQLFNMKAIEDKGNKISIVAGLLKILDNFDMHDLKSKQRYDLHDYE